MGWFYTFLIHNRLVTDRSSLDETRPSHNLDNGNDVYYFCSMYNEGEMWKQNASCVSKEYPPRMGVLFWRVGICLFDDDLKNIMQFRCALSEM